MPKVEDRKLTAKENFLRLFRGEMPEWAPVYTMGFPIESEPTPMLMCASTVLNDPHMTGGGKDVWGVNWVGSYETGGAILPEPNNFILDDITKWHDVIKAPDYSDVDWEMACKKDIENSPVPYDRVNSALGFNLYVGAFQQMMAIMGFTEGLIAMYEEPEEFSAMINYINDFYIEVGKHCIDYFDPDILVVMDDTCSQNAPFMSEELFTEILLPVYKKTYEELAAPRGIPVEFHNCGTAARFIELCHEHAGVQAWDPAQTMNDLEGFQKKWGREIAVMGGWDTTNGDLLKDDVSDEYIAQSVRDAFDKYAPNGGFAFLGAYTGALDDPVIQHRNKVVMDTALEYGGSFYD